jgi:hypothetical protein
VLETEKQINSLEYLGVGDNIILKRIIEKEFERKTTGFIELRIGTSVIVCENCNELSG